MSDGATEAADPLDERTGQSSIVEKCPGGNSILEMMVCARELKELLPGYASWIAPFLPPLRNFAYAR